MRGRIFLMLRATDPMTRVGADVEGLRQRLESSGIENKGHSAALEYIDEAAQLTKGNDLYQTLGSLVAKLEPITKVIDEVSNVSQLFLCVDGRR